MQVEFEVIEIFDDDGIDLSDANLPIYTATEVEEDTNGHSDDDVCIEELDPYEYYEEADQQDEVEDEDDENNIVLVEPEIEEPDEVSMPMINDSVEVVFNGIPIRFDSALRSDTTIKDLFSLARQEINGIDDTRELWFHFRPLGLAIGEENLYSREPTLGDMLQLSHNNNNNNNANSLVVDIENRESFFSKFNQLLSTLHVDNPLVGQPEGQSEGPSKKKRMD